MFYYSSDGKKFASKLEAVLHRETTGKAIAFYYHDDVYSKLDWKTEPPGSLDFYYKEQAQRLRDKYDYLILCYSGGYDSTNILEAFYYNNIPLDKIVIVGAFSQDTSRNTDDNHNGELYSNAFPLITKLGLEKITKVYDYTEHFDNFTKFSVAQYGTEWSEVTGGWFSPHNWFWKDISKFILPSNIGSKKVGIILGRDKPYTNPAGDFSFADSALTSYGNVQSGPGYDIVNFYWDPEFTPILLKQLHTIKGLSFLNRLDVDKLIYNLKNPLTFKSPKSPSVFLSLRDSYLVNKKNTPIYDFYMSGIKHMHAKANALKMHVILSRSYKYYD